MSYNFFEKFPKNFLKFFQLFQKSKKTIIFMPKIVQNHYINQNLGKNSLKTPKIAGFSLKTLNFSKFSALSAPKIWSFMSSNFFRKISQNFPKISWNFLKFFKIEKNVIFYPKLSIITLLIKILPNVPLKLQK